MVMQASQTAGLPISSMMPLGGMICSGLTKSPLYSVGLAVTSEPKPEPLTSSRLSSRMPGCRERTMRTSSLARHFSPAMSS